MSDNIRSDSIDLLCTKEDFIELMDDNAKQLNEITRLQSDLAVSNALVNSIAPDNQRLRAALKAAPEPAQAQGNYRYYGLWFNGPRKHALEGQSNE